MDTLERVDADPGMHAAALVSGSMVAFGEGGPSTEGPSTVIREAIARAQRRIAYLDHQIRFTQQRANQRRDGVAPEPHADHAQMLAATLVAFRHVWLHHLQDLQDLERPGLAARGRGPG